MWPWLAALRLMSTRASSCCWAGALGEAGMRALSSASVRFVVCLVCRWPNEAWLAGWPRDLRHAFDSAAATAHSWQTTARNYDELAAT